MAWLTVAVDEACGLWRFLISGMGFEIGIREWDSGFGKGFGLGTGMGFGMGIGMGFGM